MKKVLAICLALVLVVSMSLTVLAAPGKFIVSPSTRQGPFLISFTKDNDDCLGQIILTPFADRNQLPEDLKALIEYAYDQIVNAVDLSVLNAQLAQMAADLRVSITDFAVSDLFDLRREGCSMDHDHSRFTVRVKPETLENFVCLLHYHNGQWRIVEDVEITENGTCLTFSSSEFSPFAIVVNTGTPTDNPPTGDDSNIGLYAAIMGASGLALIVLWLTSKKQHSK